jgi:tRNA(Phe) wybutosine-synthesizing methylase Tyw3
LFFSTVTEALDLDVGFRHKNVIRTKWPKVIITIKTTEKMIIEISVSVSVSPFNSVFDEN